MQGEEEGLSLKKFRPSFSKQKGKRQFLRRRFLRKSYV